MKVWPVLGIAAIQAFLISAHWFLYYTISLFLPLSPDAALFLKCSLAILSISFVGAALLGYRYSNAVVSIIYKIAAVWLGFLNFIFWAACVCWIVDLPLRFTPFAMNGHARPWIASLLFTTAVATATYGIINARWIRERNIKVTLPNLPSSWRGRTALLISDVHLGNINGASFSRRMTRIARRLKPDIVFIAGDLYDGSKVDATKLASPLFEMKPPFGVFFSDGNHEDFGDPADYSATLRAGGIRVLQSEREIVDGLHVIGVSYADSTSLLHLRTYLDGLNLGQNSPSILLNHVPSRLPIVERAGVSLQLSGHTHGGQLFPFTWITRRAFGKFTYGLQRFGNLQVYTSTGAGTWGPPMRVGTAPEVVRITFA